METNKKHANKTKHKKSGHGKYTSGSNKKFRPQNMADKLSEFGENKTKGFDRIQVLQVERDRLQEKAKSQKETLTQMEARTKIWQDMLNKIKMNKDKFAAENERWRRAKKEHNKIMEEIDKEARGLLVLHKTQEVEEARQKLRDKIIKDEDCDKEANEVDRLLNELEEAGAKYCGVPLDVFQSMQPKDDDSLTIAESIKKFKQDQQQGCG